MHIQLPACCDIMLLMRTDRYKDESNKDDRKRRSRKALRLLLALIVLLVIAIAAAVLYSYRSAEDSLSVSFTEDDPKIEFGEDISAADFIKDSVGDVSTTDDEIDTNSLGEKKVIYTVSKSLYGGLLKVSKDFTFSYTVVDTVPPLVLWNGSGTVLERGTDFDIGKVLAYGDNADPSPKAKVKGKVDMDTEGEYSLHVTITDASDNKTETDLTVNVAESLPVYSGSSEHTSFKDFVSANKGSGKAFGIDVSTWQGAIDFSKVKAAGCEFVMIRIGYSSDGDYIMDSRFEKNIENARKAGLKVGLYIYSSDNDEETVRGLAKWIVENLGQSELDLPIAFDWEDFGHFQSYGISFTELNRLYDAFAEEITAAGYDCMLYGSKNYLEKVWEDIDSRPIWLAHYTDKTDYKGQYMMWQASCTGRISGIDGAVDMDIMYPGI